jgi:hypothetical protein
LRELRSVEIQYHDCRGVGRDNGAVGKIYVVVTLFRVHIVSANAGVPVIIAIRSTDPANLGRDIVVLLFKSPMEER